MRRSCGRAQSVGSMDVNAALFSTVYICMMLPRIFGLTVY